VKFISSPDNLGFSKANNIGFEESRGKYILILNPDTILSENTLEVMFRFMEEHSEVWISGCKILNADGSFQLPCRRGFPTPWVAFSKLFGLQSLFPNSKLFAKYNQTFRSIDETYYIDAIMGAFMFARADKIKELRGFDEDYFMYGEDLDLCYRTKLAGGKVAYVNTTDIIHFKGESTKRSSINDIKHFYEAMQIFVKKHYSNSYLFLSLLKMGIFLRTFIAYLLKYKKEFPLIIIDLLIINLVLVFSTSIKFGELLGFPDYAYPTVFFVISGVFFLSLFAVGEYFEGEHSVRKLLFGTMISFFFLSALTYFFKDYAFSRGVLLMTIGLTFSISSLIKVLMTTLLGKKNSKKLKRIALVTKYENYELIEKEITLFKLSSGIEYCGIFNSNTFMSNSAVAEGFEGNLEFLTKNLKELNLDEIIIIDEDKNNEGYNPLFIKSLDDKIRIHYLSKFSDYFISEIISNVATSQPVLVNHKLILPRFKFAKRFVDISISVFLLTLGLPITIIQNRKNNKYLKDVLNVLKGNYSLIGIYPVQNIRNYNAKPGLISLVSFSEKAVISNESIQKLNDFYEMNYSISLDFDIFLKSILKRGV
jgi:hypothetical protein